MPHPYEIKYPALAKKYQGQHENIGYILSVIENQCDHLFNLKDLEAMVESGTWKNTNSYIEFFDKCIKKSGDGYTEDEIKAQLFPYLSGRMSDHSWYHSDLRTPNGSTREIGLWEKFQAGVLKSDLGKNDVLKEYAFTTLDMARTAVAKSNDCIYKPLVLELRHLPYLDATQFKNKPVYIRSASGDKKGLSQWILLDYKKGIPHLYSESPISEEDKQALQVIYGTQTAVLEGGTAALSMSSGIHAVAHFIQHYGGAGLSDSADYFSLLIEWVWLTSAHHPYGKNWDWGFFKGHTLQWDQKTHEFALLDFNKNMGNANDNEHMQMRSYFLGLDWALADTPSKALEIDKKKSTVTLTVTPKLVQSNEILNAYNLGGYGTKAAYTFDPNVLKQRVSSYGKQSDEVFATTLVLNAFRACAREKKLTINLPQEFQLNLDEQFLVCYLMEMNPYVCDFQNPKHNNSLVTINNNLQHIFARNRWLSLKDYLPPMLDEFWLVAADYWVAYLKTSPDLFAESSEVNEFKRCVREMGIHGLRPLLQYLEQQKSDLSPAFNILLKNVESPPVFYAGCMAKDIKEYTTALIEHLQKKNYFPFKQFQLSFVPGVNQDIITLFTELNQQDIFDKISLMDCLVSSESKRGLQSFLNEAINKAKTDPNWACPIHIPELEKPLNDQSLAKSIELYGELNNILVKRAREKRAEKLSENPVFAHAAKLSTFEESVSTTKETKGKTQAGSALLSKFNVEVNKVWDNKKKALSLARTGGLSLQMQQQQQIKQERSRVLDNEMEKGTAYSDVLPSLLIDFNNIDQELHAYYQELDKEFPIDTTKALLSGGTTLQQFFHTWINANPNVIAPQTIHKMTPYAAKMLLKHHRQLSGGLNTDNLPRGFYTQRIASGELVLAYKSTLGYTTDHDPLTMQLTNAIPKVDRVLGDYRQFDLGKKVEPFDALRLLAQMQPELLPAERERRYQNFKYGERASLSKEHGKFYDEYELWITDNWELFYTAYRANLIDELIKIKKNAMPAQLSENTVLTLLLADAPEVREIFVEHPTIDYAKRLGQIYSLYGNYGLKRFANVILTMKNRLGYDFTDSFIENYLKHCATFSPLLQENALNTLDKMIAEMSTDPEEAKLFETFIELHMAAIGWEDITLLWKGFSYFYNHIKEMGLEKQFTPELLKTLEPKGQNLFPCFERILKSLEKIPNQNLRKELVSGIATLDLTEGGVPYAVCHDGFVLVDSSLCLREFENGAPTYKAPLESLYKPSWKEPLYTLRALGSKGHIKPQDYRDFKDKGLSKDLLIWVLHTDWKNTGEFHKFFVDKDFQFIQRIAQHFHNLFYTKNQSYRRYPLSLFESLGAQKSQLYNVLKKYPDNIAFFDCYKLVYETPDAATHLSRIFDLFLATETPKQHPHLEQGLLLATVFGVSITELETFYSSTKTLKQITRNELMYLTTQLTSLDITSLPADLALRKALWAKIIACVTKMNANPMEITEIRKDLMHRLKSEDGLVFRTSVSGDYRLVTRDDLESLGLPQFFEQHAKRLEDLLLKHIVISEAEKNHDPLKPLIEFFKRLQLNKTYINEMEPLINTLEKVLKDNPKGCWTAAYLSEMLRALQPEDSSAGFSISVFETLLTEAASPFKPKLLDEVQAHFDVEKKWEGTLNTILSKAQTFNRAQQAHLARLAVRNSQEPEFINLLVAQLAHPAFDGLREAVLQRLLAEKEPEQYSVILDQCINLVQLNPANIAETHWKSVCHLWLETLIQQPELVQTLKNIELFEHPKKELMFNILAYSSFPSHRYPTVPRADYFQGGSRAKVFKLEKKLADLSVVELEKFAACYPGKPAPDANDLLSFIKHRKEVPLDKALASFLTEDQATFRQDYKKLLGTREFDLERMLKLTYVTRGETNERIPPESGAKLMLMFQYLKQLEQGQALVFSGTKALSQMTQEELHRAFIQCSQASLDEPDNARLTIEVWAILFETLGRTTGKYPHLAQQFALIANEVLLARDPSSILQLKTGEGKSHFVALRAARHVALGNKVSVCTAKWSLAERDLLDYQQFFDYLQIPTANVHSRSAHDTYKNAQIVYTTPGDLSLFMDEQANQGTPIEIDRDRNVALGDEFDFLYYEGQKTQFNYALHTGITPKEMAWFYRGLNKFYDDLPKNKTPITPAIVEDCFAFLNMNASEDGRIYLEMLTPMTLFGWLQSAHEAAGLKVGIDYTARLEQVKIGEEEFPLREIYPLTKDMQAAVGSTFSHGVHQLVAERLNFEAQNKGEAQNYHVHPESDIISSQVFSQRLKSCFGHWEGFTGTVSSSQALELNQEHHTAVLRVPTNQKDLRKWPKPEFFTDDEERLNSMVRDIKKRIAEKGSILLCCATDAEVKEMTAALKKHFAPEEYDRHFLSYTNESHDSPAAILRKKTQMEGSYLGQKEHGVVLIAAGFGRGDNVGVETVMLGSVHDENDLGQKGGRTARNGSEGEVLQYYISDQIDDELLSLRKILLSNQALHAGVMKELNHDLEHPHLMAGFFAGKITRDLKTIDPAMKFNFLLRLREFLAAQDNYPSLVYHEAKALLSSEGIRLIGIANVEQKEQLIKGFAGYLSDLEKEWMTIQTVHDGVDERIDALYKFVRMSIQPNKRLATLFKGVGDVKCEFEPPKKPHFLLDRTLAKANSKESLVAEAQRLLLKLDSLSESMNDWKKLTGYFASLNKLQLVALLSIYKDSKVISFTDFLAQLSALAEKDKEFVSDLDKFEDKKRTIEELTLGSAVQNALIAMTAETSNAARAYLLESGLEDVKERVARATPLILFSAGNKNSLSYWEHTAARDELMSLPEQCLSAKPIVSLDVGIVLGLKKFLDNFISTEDKATYSGVFRQFLQGMEHQAEQRKRLLSDYETILNKSNNPELVLTQLAHLSFALKAPEHLVLFKTLIEKMGAEYKKPQVSIAELDAVWGDLVKAGPQLLDFLPLIEVQLAIESKKFVSLLHATCQLEPGLIVASQEFLKVLSDKDRKEGKQGKAQHSAQTIMQQMQEVFAGQKPAFLNRVFNLFTDVLTSSEFANFADKRSLFAGMLALGSSGIVREELFPKYQDPRKLCSLFYVCKSLPDQARDVAALEVILKHLSADSGAIHAQITGIKALLDAIPAQIKRNELIDKLQAFDDKNSMMDLLYLCNRFPEHAVALLSLDNVVRTLNSDYYQNELNESQKQVYIGGLQVLLDKKLLKADANLPVRLSVLKDQQKEKLFVLFKTFPSYVGKTSDTDYLPWVNYLCSAEYKNLPEDEQEKFFPGVQNLLRKGNAIFASGKGIAQFSKPDEMTQLVLLAEQYPAHADKLLALKPLIAVIAEMYDPEAQKVARKAVGNFLENQSKFKIPFESTRARIAAFNPTALTRLLDYWQRVPGHAVSIMQNNLPITTAKQATEAQFTVIAEFYKQENKNLWIRNHLMSMAPKERVALMTFLRNGDFIIRKPDTRGPKFNEQMNKQLFETGLECYKQHIDKLLHTDKGDSHRGLSVQQQGQMNNIMEEFREIGKAYVPITGAVRDNQKLAADIKAQVDAYKGTWFKNQERYRTVEFQIERLSGRTKHDNYVKMLDNIRAIKQELMQKDVQIASQQLLPTLHFWGQSRLYRTLNNIEDMVMKSWTESARQQLDSADKFAEHYQETRDSYVDEFRNALRIWAQQKQNSIFGLPAINILQNIRDKENDEIVRYLKDNPSVVRALPGTLKAIAHEVLTHDSYIPPKGGIGKEL